MLLIVQKYLEVIKSIYHYITDLVGDILKKKPKETDGIDSVIVVDNVPQVEASGTKLPKLQNVISKIFGKFGKLINEHYPAHEGGKTKG